MNKNTIVVAGVTVAALAVVAFLIFPSMLGPIGGVSAGFMKDGERVPPTGLWFEDVYGQSIDGMWAELSWTVQGENVVWSTFGIAGFYEIRLYRVMDPYVVLEKYSFSKGGEANVPTGKVAMDYMLATLLDGQPWTNDEDPTYWDLYIYGEFTASVQDTDGTVLDFDWDGETSMLTVHWVTGEFSGSGEVSSGW